MFGKLYNYIKKYQMLQDGDRIILGVSGGADSICLLHLMKQLQRKIQVELAVVHVNHMLRGEDAKQDELFVHELCDKMGIYFRAYHIPVEKIAKESGLSFEEAGRQERYRVFDEFSKEWRGNRIALAHHANDVAETMLYNLARGSGLDGLCSLVPIRENIIRPLLWAGREEIENWLRSQNLTWRTDQSNEDVSYARNRIRHLILPELVEGINAQTVRHMAATSEDLQEVQAFLREETEEKVSKYLIKRETFVLLSNELAEEKSYWQRKVLHEILGMVSTGKKDLSRVHILALQDLLQGTSGRKRDFPHGVYAEKTEQGLLLKRNVMLSENTPKDVRAQYHGKKVEVKMEEAISVPIGQDIFLENFLFRAELDKNMEIRLCAAMEENRQSVSSLLPQKLYTKWIDYDKINEVMELRKRRPGDYITINSGGSKKKLQRYFIDHKIPSSERDSIWLLADGQEIIWIIGYRLSQRFLVTKQTKHVLRIQIEGEKFDE